MLKISTAMPATEALLRMTLPSAANEIVVRSRPARFVPGRVPGRRPRCRPGCRHDGTGFDVKRADSETDHVHLGLVGMRERMQIIGGTLQIRSAAGRGTTVTATAER